MDVIHELTAQYDSRKSFYGKAMTDGSNLWSYKTLVASWDEETQTMTLFPKWDCSQTTRRHVREFITQKAGPGHTEYERHSFNYRCTLMVDTKPKEKQK